MSSQAWLCWSAMETLPSLTYKPEMFPKRCPTRRLVPLRDTLFFPAQSSRSSHSWHSSSSLSSVFPNPKFSIKNHDFVDLYRDGCSNLYFPSKACSLFVSTYYWKKNISIWVQLHLNQKQFLCLNLFSCNHWDTSEETDDTATRATCVAKKSSWSQTFSLSLLLYVHWVAVRIDSWRFTLIYLYYIPFMFKLLLLQLDIICSSFSFFWLFSATSFLVYHHHYWLRTLHQSILLLAALCAVIWTKMSCWWEEKIKKENRQWKT